MRSSLVISALLALGCQSAIVGADCRYDLVECGGVCVDTDDDRANCGGCGVECAAGEQCVGGVCGGDLDGGAVSLEGGASDGSVLDGDTSMDGARPDGALRDGEIPDGYVGDGGPKPGCDVGERECDGSCRDLRYDPSNCGGCGVTCAVGEVCAAGECLPSCRAPYATCDGQCVDPRSHQDHCGGCGNVCPSGVCAAGACQSAVAGHVVAVGHSFASSRPLSHGLAGNSVFLTRANPARVVVYEEHALPAAVTGTDGAIDDVAMATGRSWTREAVTAEDVPFSLASADVFVVYAQAGADDERIADLGQLWARALETFLRTGGVVVVFDGVGVNTGTHRVLSPSGFMSSAGTQDVTGRLLEVVRPGDAVALGVPLRYRGEPSTVRIDTLDGDPVVSDGVGPVVVHRVVLP